MTNTAKSKIKTASSEIVYCFWRDLMKRREINTLLEMTKTSKI